MKPLLYSLITFIFFASACINQGAKRAEQAAKEKEENDSIFIVKKPFSGSDKIEYEIPVLKGTKLRHGVQKRYYLHGSLYSEIPYVKNKREGFAITYYKAYNDEKPQVWKIQQYSNGKLDGICKRFYKSGKLQSEYEYKKGIPAVGLKEYKESGELINQPSLKVNCSSANSGYYYITGKLSKPKKNVTYYSGKLIEGKYLPVNMRKMQERNGVAEVLIPKSSGQEYVTVSAEFSTYLGNKCILSKTIKICN